jgi:hypothetical protein
MPLYAGLITIKRDGKYHPPGTLHDLDEHVAKALGSSRVRLHHEQAAIVSAPALPSADLLPGLVSEPVDDVGDVPPAELPTSPDSAGGASERVVEIMHAIDLVPDDEYVKTGPRAGKPKLAPLEDVLGYSVTADEVDAALELHREMFDGD